MTASFVKHRRIISRHGNRLLVGLRSLENPCSTIRSKCVRMQLYKVPAIPVGMQEGLEARGTLCVYLAVTHHTGTPRFLRASKMSICLNNRVRLLPTHMTLQPLHLGRFDCINWRCIIQSWPDVDNCSPLACPQTLLTSAVF